MAIFDFRDASLRGSKQWSRASPHYAAYAPLLILNLLIISIIQIVLGVVHITSISSLGSTANLTFAQVIQPLVIPALSFFNTVPSLHLHVLARSNKPLMAIIFSSIMATVYFASAVIFLPPCVDGSAFSFGSGSGSGASAAARLEQGSYANTECPVGTRIGVWSTMVALQFISAVGYLNHALMAGHVRMVERKRARDEAEGRVLVTVDPVAKARREEEARRRWMEIRDL